VCRPATEGIDGTYVETHNWWQRQVLPVWWRGTEDPPRSHEPVSHRRVAVNEEELGFDFPPGKSMVSFLVGK
jgi:hypothetical protein